MEHAAKGREGCEVSTAARKKAEQSGNLDGFLAKKYRAHGFHIETASRESALRGAAKRAALYAIEGQYVTADQLAERMGTTKEKAVSKLSKVRAQPGPITWAKLGVSDV